MERMTDKGWFPAGGGIDWDSSHAFLAVLTRAIPRMLTGSRADCILARAAT
jgi:hypothetical protein